jgi:hypothetical protein
MDITVKDVILIIASGFAALLIQRLTDKYIPNWSKKRLEKKYQNKLTTHNEINEVAESMDKINYYAGISRHHQLEVIYVVLGIFFITFIAWDIPAQNRMLYQSIELIIYPIFMIGLTIFLVYDRKKSRYYKFVSAKAYELYKLNQKENGNTLSK